MTHMAPVILEQAPILSVRPPETVSMRTRDGVRLDADVYRPDAVGPWPVLLLRLTCGRRTAMTGHYAHPRWYAARGYVVVVQDVRGRGTSEGRFRPFEAEREDGADAVAWAASLPGSNGTVGMYGSGYAGMAQLLALAERPAALRALVPALAGWDDFTDWANPADVEYAPTMTLDLTAGMRVTDRARVELVVTNLTDENHYEVRGYPLPGRSIAARTTVGVR